MSEKKDLDEKAPAEAVKTVEAAAEKEPDKSAETLEVKKEPEAAKEPEVTGTKEPEAATQTEPIQETAVKAVTAAADKAPVENTDSKELKQILKYSKITSIATCCICAVLLISALLIVPKVMHVISQAETEMTAVSEFTDTIDDTLQQTNQIVSGVNQIDFDQLSSSINSLSQAVAVLGSFMN